MVSNINLHPYIPEGLGWGSSGISQNTNTQKTGPSSAACGAREAASSDATRPAALSFSFEELHARAASKMLYASGADRPTEEYTSFRRFMSAAVAAGVREDDDEALAKRVPNATPADRVSSLDPAAAAALLTCDGGAGRPVVVADGGKRWDLDALGGAVQA